MGFLSGVGDLLKKVTGGQIDPANVEQHFDQISQSVPGASLANGISAAIHSDQTPDFSQIASQLFSNANGEQKASMLSGLLASVGPGVISKFAGSNPDSPLAKLLQAGQTAITPDQAASVSAGDVSSLADNANKEDPSIIDRMSAIYAQHPTLIKSLGAAVMAIAVKKVAENHSS